MITAYYLIVMFVTLAFIWGLNYACRSGEIFGDPADWMRAHAPKWINTPLFDCPYCMASVWGTIFFVVFLWGLPWYLWVIFCFCLTGLGHLIKE